MDVSDQIIKVLNDLSEKAGIAVDWSSANILPSIQKVSSNIVRYELISSVVWTIIAIIIIVIMIVLLKNTDIEKGKDDSERAGLALSSIIYIIIAICFSICLCVQIFDIIRCIVYPERVIIDEIISIRDSYIK